MLFTSLLCDVTPVVCQTKGRRCFMWSLSLSLSFFPDLYSFSFIYLFKTQTSHSVLRHSFSRHRMAVWESGHITLFLSRSLSFFSHSLSLGYTHTHSPCFLHHNTSIHPGHCWVVVLSARAWRTQPLKYASPLWPGATTVLFAVLQIHLGGQGHRLWAFLEGGRRHVSF